MLTYQQVLTASDFAQVDKRSQLLARVRSRLKILQQYSQHRDAQYSTELYLETVAHLRDLARRLVKSYIIDNYRECYDEMQRYPRTAKEHVRQIFGVEHQSGSVSDPYEARYLSDLKDLSLKSRKAQFVARVQAAFLEHKDKYPYFLTLTTRPEHYSEVFGSYAAWRKFIRAVKYRYKEVHYVAVTEKGKLGRYHLHCIVWLPEAAGVDPLQGRCATDIRREVYWQRKYWSYGISQAIPIRFSPLDSFGRAGWRWPEGPSLPPQALARYLGKYLDQPRLKEDYQWRTRLSRMLGMEWLRSQTDKLTLQQLTQAVATRLQLPELRVPRALLRRVLAKKVVALARKNQKQYQEYLQMAPRPTILMKLRAITLTSWQAIRMKISARRPGCGVRDGTVPILSTTSTATFDFPAPTRPGVILACPACI